MFASSLVSLHIRGHIVIVAILNLELGGSNDGNIKIILIGTDIFSIIRMLGKTIAKVSIFDLIKGANFLSICFTGKVFIEKNQNEEHAIVR